MKFFAYLMTCLILVATAEANAKGNNHRNNQMTAQAKAAKAAKEKKEKERDEKNGKIKDYLTEVDTNHDGSVSKEEFLSGEANKEQALRKFEEANKNHDSALTKSEIADMLGL